MLTISRLTVENLTTGCVTDQRHPEISFALESDGQNISLQYAEISLDDWQITTTEQTAVPYEGKALLPFTTYQVQVRAVSSDGETAQAKTTFETGRMGLDWKGKWITDGDYHLKKGKASPLPMTFCKTFSCRDGMKRAQIYTTALGIYELFINGEKVGTDYFSPGFTSYRNQLQYQVYDVTGLLKKANELVAVIGGGWAVGSFTHKRRNRVFAKRQAFMSELRILYADGTEEIIGTDDSWMVTEEGNYREAEFYNGEVYDATIDLKNLTWRPAALEKVTLRPRILAQYGAPVRAHEIFHPVSVVKAKSGMLIYDFGQNFAGVIAADINGEKGQKITFRHAELLMGGELYTEPLRTAKQEAVYICKAGRQQYSPRLTYMGFRYVGVTGVNKEELELSAIALYSDVEDNGEFSCSNPLLNQLQSNIRWGARSNFVDIPTDCPQRDERLGWTGDIALFAPTAAYNFNMSRFFEKWLLDVKAEQTRGGGIPVTVPLVRVYFQWEIMIPMAVDHWGDACILVPWAEYRARGDLGLLRDMYPTMKRYIKACTFWAGLGSSGKRRRIWKLLHHYGDWCAPGIGLWGWMGRGKWTATACLAHSSKIVAEIARLLGHEDEAAEYETLSRETARAYREILMQADCSVKKEFQTAYVLPLYYGMLCEEDRKKTAAHLARMIRSNDYHIGTGFPGTPYVLFALADNGYAEDAFRMLLTDSCPSWLYEVKTGATTIWERWDALREDGTCNTGASDGTGGMVSFNHYAGGAVGDFLYRRIAGIEAVEGGYRSFKIEPLVGGDITWASGAVSTPYGRIKSEWHCEGGRFSIRIEVPVGTRCEVILPDGTRHKAGSGICQFSCETETVKGGGNV